MQKILILGQRVFGQEKPDLSKIKECQVDILRFPEEYGQVQTLTNYDFVFLDYSTFVGTKKIFKKEQEVFEKEMEHALDEKTWFCFLHYDEMYPGADRRDHPFRTTTVSQGNCYNTQIGFRWLYGKKISTLYSAKQILKARVHRTEFTIFQKRWGSTHNYFSGRNRDDLGDIIISVGNQAAIGFALSVGRGRLMYLPFQRDESRASQIADGLKTLIKSCVLYRSHVGSEIPTWAEAPIFGDETVLQQELLELRHKVQTRENDLAPYRELKKLCFLREYDFQEAVPKFLHDKLGLLTEVQEEFKEDFWILNDDRKQIAIGETKTCKGAAKKDVVYGIYNHRQNRQLDETFPAVTIVNAFLDAKSWKQKQNQLDAALCRLAVENNVLLLRIEDLIHCWCHFEKFGKNELLKLILQTRGWLEFRSDGTHIIHP